MSFAGPLLSSENLSFHYGRTQVLYDVDIHVAQGEALALLGTNGAGKSTWLRAVAGLRGPSAGRVYLAGDDVTGRAAEALVAQGVVLVNGGRAVFGDMTVGENLEIQSYTLRRDRNAIAAGRERVFASFPRLHERLHQKAGSLSGGEQQQLAIAKAVALDPRVLMIDELSLGLAPVVVQELLTIVRDIHRQGTTIVLVEQSLNIAAHVCERAVFLEKGGVRFEGRTADLLERDDIARAVFLGSA